MRHLSTRAGLAVGAGADAVGLAAFGGALADGLDVVFVADGADLDGEDAALGDIPSHAVVGGLEGGTGADGLPLVLVPDAERLIFLLCRHALLRVAAA